MDEFARIGEWIAWGIVIIASVMHFYYVGRMLSNLTSEAEGTALPGSVGFGANNPKYYTPLGNQYRRRSTICKAIIMVVGIIAVVLRVSRL